MPIYEYLCDACGHELESLQKLGAVPLVNCPSCNKASLRKLISAAGFQLKGTGWYATDFKAGAKSATAANDSSKEESKQAANKDEPQKKDDSVKKESSAKEESKPTEKKADAAPSSPATTTE